MHQNGGQDQRVEDDDRRARQPLQEPVICFRASSGGPGLNKEHQGGVGDEEARQLAGDELRILAAADRDASRLRGDGEAQAISILAESLNKDPDFFSFRRSLEAYTEFLNDRTTLILSTDAPIFKFLQSPGEGSSQTNDGNGGFTDPLGLQ